jgi:hypothetical protein
VPSQSKAATRGARRTTESIKFCAVSFAERDWEISMPFDDNVR